MKSDKHDMAQLRPVVTLNWDLTRRWFYGVSVCSWRARGPWKHVVALGRFAKHVSRVSSLSTSDDEKRPSGCRAAGAARTCLDVLCQMFSVVGPEPSVRIERKGQLISP